MREGGIGRAPFDSYGTMKLKSCEAFTMKLKPEHTPKHHDVTATDTKTNKQTNKQTTKQAIKQPNFTLQDQKTKRQDAVEIACCRSTWWIQPATFILARIAAFVRFAGNEEPPSFSENRPKLGGCSNWYVGIYRSVLGTCMQVLNFFEFRTRMI